MSARGTSAPFGGLHTVTPKHIFLFVLCFAIAASLLHSRSYNALPSQIHTWVQSDHYALSLGFLGNEFNFFKPETFALSHEFPAESVLENPRGITSTDFPAFQFVVAAAMSALGTTEPWVFRLASLLMSFAALLMLYVTISKIKGVWVAALLCGFIMFQPIYSFYQNGFHISMASNSVFLVACCFLLRSYHLLKPSYAVWAIVFFTLAALMRFTLVIFPLALVCIYSIRFLRSRKIGAEFLAVLLGIALVVAYFLFNKNLALEYGSIFLAKPIIAESIGALISHLVRIAASYSRGLLPFLHLFVLGLLIYGFYKAPAENKQKMQEWLLWLVFAVLGTACFTLLMSWSIGAHDYYALDTWQPIIVIALLYLIYPIETDNWSLNTPLLVSAILLGLFSVALEQQYRKYDQRLQSTEPDLLMQDFAHSAAWLNSLNMPSQQTVLIAGPGWNTPFIGWRHKAFRIAADFNEQVPALFTQPHKYIVTHNRHFEEQVMSACPNYRSLVEPLGDNGRVSVWQVSNAALEQNICSAAEEQKRQ